MRVTREQLHKEVWSEPMTTVAKRYELSSSFLARVCERLNVPRPSRGYWAQRAAGVEVEQLALPAAEPGQELEWVRGGPEPRREPLSAGPRQGPRKGQSRPEKHPLLVGACAHFDHARESHDEPYVRPYKRTLVDIFVSKDLLDRALKVASDLFLTLEDRGQRVMLAPAGGSYQHVAAEIREGEKTRENYYSSSGRWAPGQPTITLVGDVAIGLTIFEVSDEVEVRYDSKLHTYVRVESPKLAEGKRARRIPEHAPWTSKRWLPSGRLGVHAFAPYHGVDWEQYWREAKPGELSELLGKIGSSLTHANPTCWCCRSSWTA